MKNEKKSHIFQRKNLRLIVMLSDEFLTKKQALAVFHAKTVIYC